MSTSQAQLLDPELVSWLDHFAFKPPSKSSGQRLGSYANKQKGSSLRFAGHRNYLPGDNPKHIDWKVFARSNKLALKTFEKESELQCSILLDTSASMRFSGESPSKLHFASELAAALSYLLLKQGERVSFAGLNDQPSSQSPPRSGAKHFLNIEQRLQTTLGIGAKGNQQLHLGLKNFSKQKKQRNGWVVILSDFFDDATKLQNELKSIRAHGLNVLALAVLDDYELNLPWDELTHFVPLEEGESIVADPKSLKKEYQKKLRAFLQTIEHTITTTGGQFQLCPTNVSIQDTLLSLFSTQGA